jgi:hypothetical protein
MRALHRQGQADAERGQTGHRQSVHPDPYHLLEDVIQLKRLSPQRANRQPIKNADIKPQIGSQRKESRLRLKTLFSFLHTRVDGENLAEPNQIEDASDAFA